MFKTLKEKIDHVNAAIDEAFGIETADWKKQLIAGVVGVAVYAGIASAGIIATNLLVATLAGTSVFLGVFISIISLMLTFMAALYAATKASTFVLMFDYANIEQRVAGWFGRGAVAKADAVDEVIAKKPRTRRANGVAMAH